MGLHQDGNIDSEATLAYVAAQHSVHLIPDNPGTEQPGQGTSGPHLHRTAFGAVQVWWWDASQARFQAVCAI